MSETSQASSEYEKIKRPRGARKKQVHNAVERRRKDKINAWIGKISELLPGKELFTQSKIGILEKTVEYIKILQIERDKLLTESHSDVQAGEIKKLRRNLKMLKEKNTLYENLLISANININSLPKKPTKYSKKFILKNGISIIKDVTILANNNEDVIECSTISETDETPEVIESPTDNDPRLESPVISLADKASDVIDFANVSETGKMSDDIQSTEVSSAIESTCASEIDKASDVTRSTNMSETDKASAVEILPSTTTIRKNTSPIRTKKILSIPVNKFPRTLQPKQSVENVNSVQIPCAIPPFIPIIQNVNKVAADSVNVPSTVQSFMPIVQNVEKVVTESVNVPSTLQPFMPIVQNVEKVVTDSINVASSVQSYVPIVQNVNQVAADSLNVTSTVQSFMPVVQNIRKVATDSVNVSSSVPSYVPINFLSSNQPFPVAPFPMAASNNAQGNLTAIVNCGNVTRNLPSLDSCGVTSVLSPFPVMSTTHESSIYNKTMPTIIIPTGGNIMQQFLTSEKASNTISFICPTTMPIIVPQQVFNMSSMSKTVNLSSTLLDFNMSVNNPCLPSSLGNTLVTINPSSMVSITSATPNTPKVVLPSAQFGTTCSNRNSLTDVTASLSQVSRNQVLVPLVANSSASASVTATVNSVTNSNGNTTTAVTVSLPQLSSNQLLVPSVSSLSVAASLTATVKAKADMVPQISSINTLEKENRPIVQNKHIIPALKTNDLENKSLKSIIEIKRASMLSNSAMEQENQCCTKKQEQKKNISPKKQDRDKQIKKFSLKGPPSLQVLSANKIISLANQSQKVKAKNLLLPLNEKTSLKTSSLLPNASESNKNCVNNLCLQIDSPEGGINLKRVENSIDLEDAAMRSEKDSPVSSTINSGPKMSESNISTNFSLTVLMGESNLNGKETNGSVSQNEIEICPAAIDEKINVVSKSIDLKSTTFKQSTSQNISNSVEIFPATLVDKSSIASKITDMKSSLLKQNNLQDSSSFVENGSVASTHCDSKALATGKGHQNMNSNVKIMPTDATISCHSNISRFNLSSETINYMKGDEYVPIKNTTKYTASVSDAPHCTNALKTKSNIEIIEQPATAVTTYSHSSTSKPTTTNSLGKPKNATLPNCHLTKQSSTTQLSDVSLNISKSTQFHPNGMTMTPAIANTTIPRIAIENVNVALGETALPLNESNLNQNVMPFHINQSISDNSSFYLGYPVNENTNSSFVLPNSVTKYNNSTVSSGATYSNMSHHPYFLDQSKDLAAVPNSTSDIMSMQIKSLNQNEIANRRNNVSNARVMNSNFKANIQPTENSENASHHMQQTSHLNNDFPKHPPKKKSKPISKNLISSNENVANNFTNCSVNKSQTITKMPEKLDASLCGRPDSNNYSFTSDILARATESIFGSDVPDNSQHSKKTPAHYSDNNMNITSIITSSASKTDDLSCKLQSLDTSKEHLNIAHTSEKYHEHNVSSAIKDKKNIFTDTSAMFLMTSVKQSSLHNANEINTTQMPSINSSSINDASVGTNIQELNKQNKSCKTRKAKANPDIEPPTKKIKGLAEGTDKIANIQNFEQPMLVAKEQNTRIGIDMQLSLQCGDKDSHHIFDSTDQANIESIHMNNNMMPENHCKTPSVDNVFSLTPMLGDILKDVPHGIGADARNNFLNCNDNQSGYISEKNNFVSFNYGNNVNEDYLNLPRMYFPIVPEVPPAPAVQATNVSFAHTVSLCSTQSDSSKSAGTLLSTDLENKLNSKKKVLSSSSHLAINQDLPQTDNSIKEPVCNLKPPNPALQFGVVTSKMSNSTLLLDQNIDLHSSNANTLHVSHAVSSHANSHFNARDTYSQPVVSHSINFYSTPSSVSNIQQNIIPNSSSSLPHNYNCSNPVSIPYSSQSTNSGTGSYNSKADSLSHSLCSLLKETNNILTENRSISTTSAVSQSINSSSSANISQSKYSALSLISDQSFTETASSSGCQSEYVQAPVTGTLATSSPQYTASSSMCSRNSRSSLSYSAESLLQTSCVSSDKNKNKNIASNRYQHRLVDKKGERENSSNLHNITDTNIFMPVSNCDISIQNAPLVPLPPVTSFHNFPSNYTMCEVVPTTTLFNSVTRAHDIPSLSNDNFLSHGLNIESQMLSNRHLNHDATVPKPHTNLSLPFENHGPLYNNCNFLQHNKPTLENTRTSDTGGCFQAPTFNNSYSQQSQKPNCCHFTHRTIATNPELPSDINLPAAPPVPSFHTEKSSLHVNRPHLQPNFSQSNTNFVGNFFYNPNGNMVAAKPSNSRMSQEVFVNEGARQSIHEHNSITGAFPPNRKNATSNRTKTKKAKSVQVNESIVNHVPNSIVNFCTPQDPSCNKPNVSYVPNGYFKNNSQSVMIPPPSQLQCAQSKLPDKVINPAIPPNPPFNPTLHQQGENFFNLNFQPPLGPAMNSLPRPPTQPLSCTCLTASIITPTFASTTHPVPNFNLSNILPDMGCSGNTISLSPAKFPPNNHSLQPSSAQCQPDPSMSNTAHIVSHQSCVPSLYPPHPSMVRGNVNPILGHNPQSINESQISLVGGGNSAIPHQNAAIVGSQNPTYRNVIHPLNFPRSDR